jgi:hypothetical protein
MFEINSLGCMYKWIQIDMIRFAYLWFKHVLQNLTYRERVVQSCVQKTILVKKKQYQGSMGFL